MSNSILGTTEYQVLTKIEGLEGIEGLLKELIGTVKQLKGGFDNLNTSTKKTERSFIDNARSINDYQNNVKYLRDKVKKLDVTTADYRDNLKKLKIAQNDLSKASIGLSGGFMQSLKSALSLDRVLSRLSFIGLAGMVYGSTRALKEFFDEGIKGAIDFERQMSKVFTMLSGVDSLMRTQLTETVKNLAVEYGQTTETITKGFYDILSATFSANEATQVLEASLRAATGGFTDASTAADAIVSVLKAYDMEASQAADVSDLLFAIVQRGRLTFEDLARNLGNVIPTAGLVGISLEELGAAIATTTRQGVSARMTMTSLNNLMMAFVKPSKQALEVAKDLNIELSAQALREKGLTGIIKQLQGATEEQLVVLGTSKRAFRALAAGVNDMSGQFEDLDVMTNRSGQTLRKFAEAADDTAFKVARGREAIKGWGRSVGDAFLGVIGGASDLVSGIDDITTALAKAASEVEKMNKILPDSADRYEELANKVNRTAEEDKEYYEILQSLAKIYPEIVDKTNARGQAIGLNIDKLRELIKEELKFANSDYIKNIQRTGSALVQNVKTIDNIRKALKVFAKDFESMSGADLLFTGQIDAGLLKKELDSLSNTVKKELNTLFTVFSVSGENAKQNFEEMLAFIFNNVELPTKEMNRLVAMLWEEYDDMMKALAKETDNVGLGIKVDVESTMAIKEDFLDITEAIETTNAALENFSIIMGQLKEASALKSINEILPKITTNLDFLDASAKAANREVLQMFQSLMAEGSYSEALALLKELANVYGIDLKEKVKELGEAIKNEIPADIQFAADKISGLFEAFTGEIINFNRSMRENFESAWDAIKKYFFNVISQMIAKFLAFQLLTGIFPSIFGSAGTVSLSKFIFGGARAEGGDVRGNTPYLVGEKGAELFVPKQDGYIVPNNYMRNLDISQIQPSVVNNNFSPINNISVDARFSPRDMAFIVREGNRYNNKREL